MPEVCIRNTLERGGFFSVWQKISVWVLVLPLTFKGKEKEKNLFSNFLSTFTLLLLKCGKTLIYKC